jgi:hypothetical protein
MTKNWRKKLKLKKVKNIFLIKNYNSPFPRPPIKDVQAAEEAFSPQKRTSSTSTHEIYLGHFCPPGSGSGFRFRIRIHLPD